MTGPDYMTCSRVASPTWTAGSIRRRHCTRCVRSIWADKAKEERLIIARHNSELVGCGFVAFRETAVHLGKLAVGPGFRRRGVPARDLSILPSGSRATMASARWSCKHASSYTKTTRRSTHLAL